MAAPASRYTCYSFLKQEVITICLKMGLDTQSLLQRCGFVSWVCILQLAMCFNTGILKNKVVSVITVHFKPLLI